MAVFRWRHFAGEIILWAVRWYCRYGISYRELEEMMGERGVTVDHTTLYRSAQPLDRAVVGLDGVVCGRGRDTTVPGVGGAYRKPIANRIRRL